MLMPKKLNLNLIKHLTVIDRKYMGTDVSRQLRNAMSKSHSMEKFKWQMTHFFPMKQLKEQTYPGDN